MYPVMKSWESEKSIWKINLKNQFESRCKSHWVSIPARYFFFSQHLVRCVYYDIQWAIASITTVVSFPCWGIAVLYILIWWKERLDLVKRSNEHLILSELQNFLLFSQNGLSAVMVASKNGHLHIVKELLDINADITLQTKVMKCS